jgi:FeS assembly protein IscX
MKTTRFGWDDPREIAIRLLETRPDTHPLSVRFTDLRAWVLELEGFAGDPAASNEKTLEAIQMAWLDEFED